MKLKVLMIVLAAVVAVSAVTVVVVVKPFGKSSSTETTSESEPASVETYKVRFVGTNMQERTVEKGTVLNQPTDPSKSQHIFGGWYMDSNYSIAADFPIEIETDTSLYAKFYDYKTAFIQARNKTVGQTVPGFEYDYNLTATATYYNAVTSSISLNGNTQGNAKYSSSGEVSFYDSHDNSGSLFYDGSEYQIRKESTLQKISLNEKGLLRDYSVEEVDDSYRFDSSSFAKALFEYDDSKLKSVESTQVRNEYKLNTSFNVSSAISMAGKILNNAVVKKLIENVPETNVDTGMYVTFSNGEVSSYRYEMKISVTSVTFNLVYQLNFKNVGKASVISPRVFAGLSLTNAEIEQTSSEVKSYLSAFISQEHSGYDFNVKTGVNFPSKNSIDATFKGSALRKISGSTVYFHNDIEIDSDLKNADLYKAAGISDVHVKRTRLSDGKVWLIEKKVLVDKTTEVTPYTANATDSRYLFDIINQIHNFTFVQKVSKDSTTTYSVGVAKSDVANVLTWLNSELNLDPLGNSTAKAKVFGEFNSSSVVVDEVELVIEVKNGVLQSVSFKTDGDFTTSFAGSGNFTQAAKANFDLDYTLTVNAAGDSFEPYENVNKAK